MPPKNTTQLLAKLRSLMQDVKVVKEPIQAYIMPSNDAHNSEYPAVCDEFRSYISGFSGSAGTAIVTQQEALLWTDGRYFLQAGQQLDDNWGLMKEGVATTPTQGAWLCKALPSSSKIGVDPKLYTAYMWRTLQRQLETAGHQLIPIAQNLIQCIWEDRPKRPANSIQPLQLQFSGKSVGQKLSEIYEKMSEKNADYLVLTALDEIAWLLNARGTDIEYNPVFFAYVVISKNDTSVAIFLNQCQSSEALESHFTTEMNPFKYVIKPYSAIDDYITGLTGKKIWFAESSSYALTSLLPSGSIILTDITPVSIMKAIKNPVEIQGMRNAHIKDAVALCRYFAWLEKCLTDASYNSDITEISGADKLEAFRAEQADFMGPSFATISSVGPHGAIIHYKPQVETDSALNVNSVYLCDSGGQYRDGTTDVTRTMHFGQPTNYEKECFTRVLKGQIKLATTVFPAKIKGNCLDSFARQYLWEVGLDYGHGTGHGIGSYLNVHEGPMGISWRAMPTDPGLESGMFLSNEPGYYEDGSFGIRIEDIVQIVPAKTTYHCENKLFLTFETITLVPKQSKMIVVEMLTDSELEYLNGYHKQCRDVIGPLLDQIGDVSAKTWLIRETQALSKC